MRLSFCFALLMCMVFTTLSSATEKQIPSLKTLSGKTYTNVEFDREEGTRTVFFHSSGVASIKTQDLPAEIRKNWNLLSDAKIEAIEREQQERLAAYQAQQEAAKQEELTRIKTEQEELARKEAEQKKKAEQKQQQIDKVKAEFAKLPAHVQAIIKSVEGGNHYPYMPFVTRMQVGNIGTFKYSLTISQIIDDSTALLRRQLGDSFEWEYAFFVGLNTAGLVDDAQILPSGLWQVSGTQTYQTLLGGSNTVLVLTPFDMSPYSKIMNDPYLKDALGLRKTAKPIQKSSPSPLPPARQKCSTCQGDGYIFVSCPKCGGDGKIQCESCKWRSPPCMMCRGTGEVPCKYCNGKGNIKKDCPDCEDGYK